jgi:DNA-binding MarR family transcriptional regulator
MSRTAFLEMLIAYRQTIGRAYPQRDPISVFHVLEECASPIGTTQIAITKATGVRRAEVNKVVGQAVQFGWIERGTSRSSSGSKTVMLTPAGRQMIADFERRCVAACTPRPTPTNNKNNRRQPAGHQATLERLTVFEICKGT